MGVIGQRAAKFLSRDFENDSDPAVLSTFKHFHSHKIELVHPYYISPIEIRVLRAKITYLSSHSIALACFKRTYLARVY